MSVSTPRKGLTLKGLQLLQICARKGSLQATAAETGSLISTIYRLRSLEDHLGIETFNHSRRPMVLTPKGHVFLRSIGDAPHAIRKGKAEAASGNVTETRYLRIGSIEDFDSDITPVLAVYLSEWMPDCDFLYQTATTRYLWPWSPQTRAGQSPRRCCSPVHSGSSPSCNCTIFRVGRLRVRSPFYRRRIVRGPSLILQTVRSGA